MTMRRTRLTKLLVTAQMVKNFVWDKHAIPGCNRQNQSCGTWLFELVMQLQNLIKMFQMILDFQKHIGAS